MRFNFTVQIVLWVLFGVGAVASSMASAAEAIDYASAPTQSAPSRVIPVRIDRNFTLYERAKIFRAVTEWNHVLSGHVRLDISPDGFDAEPYPAAGKPRPEGWIVAKIDSRNPMLDGHARHCETPK